MNASYSNTVDVVLQHLKGVRSSGNGHMALCPAHEDRQPSLSISEGDDGRALLKCFAGCSTDQILAHAGLTMSDLFAQPLQSARPSPTSGRAWTIKDENGKPIAVHRRKNLPDG